jgi:acetyl-CoA carboxylase biotin carboxylase subunit
MRKILVANRGEIALRIMRSAREMGLRTVAVFSEADRAALHVQYADEAYPIGPAPSLQSYLSGAKILAAARQAKADAIHPGYGFLSENAGFAESVVQAGITFIGPSAGAMRRMGSKLNAREEAQRLGIPMVPGSGQGVSDPAAARQAAGKTGYPLLIKASAGGGGKGMRLVKRPEDLDGSLRSAMNEAMAAFGDPSVYIEKYVRGPRHIEIQVLGDAHGGMVHLFERECSIQRRHQKVIEEAPSSVLTPALRDEMGTCAVRLAASCGYTGAGTVEFLLDEDKNFYFLEMNTRLQVEHPVTEQVTGLDLVKEQIRVARGETLGYGQADLSVRGHAVEARVYAEDPYNGFLPDTGRLETYRRPGGAGVRVDDGYDEGMDIPVYYDPMIAKLIASGRDRQEAIARLVRAIDDYEIAGVATTLPFCRFVLLHEAFVSGRFDTHFIDRYFRKEAMPEGAEDHRQAAALAVFLSGRAEAAAANHRPANGPAVSRWKANRLNDTD